MRESEVLPVWNENRLHYDQSKWDIRKRMRMREQKMFQLIESFRSLTETVNDQFTLYTGRLHDKFAVYILCPVSYFL